LEAKLGAKDCKDCTIDKALSLLDCILDISNNILDYTNYTMDPVDCTKFTNNSTDFTDSAVKSIGCTNCAELTNVQKHYVSNNKG